MERYNIMLNLESQGIIGNDATLLANKIMKRQEALSENISDFHLRIVILAYQQYGLIAALRVINS